MVFRVNVHYGGGWLFDIDAKSEEEAREKAEVAFGELSPKELVDNLAEVFADDCWQMKEEHNENANRS